MEREKQDALERELKEQRELKETGVVLNPPSPARLKTDSDKKKNWKTANTSSNNVATKSTVETSTAHSEFAVVSTLDEHSRVMCSENTNLASSESAKQQTQTFNKNQPMFYSVGQDNILIPLPANNPVVRKTLPSASSFNPADFENELDPFDNLELKTLDDMKELDKVLQNVKINYGSGQNEIPSQSMNSVSKVVTPKQDFTGQFSNQAVFSQNQQPAQQMNYSQNGLTPQHYGGYVPPGGRSNIPNMNVVSSSVSKGVFSSAPPASALPVSINHTSGSVSYKSSVDKSNPVQGDLSSQLPSMTPNVQQFKSPNTSTIAHTSSSYSHYTFANTSNNYNYTGSAGKNSSSISNFSGNSQNNSVVPPQSNNPSQSQAPSQYQVWTEFLQKSGNSAGVSPYANNASLSASYYSSINGYTAVLGKNLSDKVKETGSRSQGHSRSNTPPPSGTGQLRSARSTPDLVALGKDSEPAIISSRSPPIPRRLKCDSQQVRFKYVMCNCLAKDICS